MKEVENIYGIHSIEAAIKETPENLTSISIEKNRKDERIKSLIKLAESVGMKIEYISKQQFEKVLPHVNHQGVMGSFIIPKAKNENDLLDMLDALEENPFLAILDCVQDPHNLGACMRTANSAGVHAIIVPKNNSASLSPTVFKVASGAAFAVPLIAVTNLARIIMQLKERNITIIGLSDQGNQPIFDLDLKSGIALIFGGEGKGMRRLTKENCDIEANIPMYGIIDSLNVSVAAGISMFEVVRQRSGVSN